MQVWQLYTGFDDLRGLADGNPLSINAPIAAFVAVALYNSLELLVMIYMTFTHYSSLYFWSLLCTTFFGVFCSSLAFILYYFEIITNQIVPSITLPIVWMFLVTGHSLVLYSRLHLVSYERRVLRAVLAMIIIDATILHTTTIVISVISVAGKKHDQKILDAYKIIERIEITWFTVQELIISGIYIYYTFQLLTGCNTSRRRAVFYQLIIINILEIIMDVALITLQYLGIYLLQMILKITVYSIKLKLEFAVLRQIVKISHVTQSSGQLPDFVQTGRLPLPQSPGDDEDAIKPSSSRKGSGLSGHLSLLPVYFKR